MKSCIACYLNLDNNSQSIFNCVNYLCGFKINQKPCRENECLWADLIGGKKDCEFELWVDL